MKESVTELEQLIVQNLKSTNLLKNELEKKENEKHDLLKDISLNIIDIIDSFERIEESIIEKEYNKIDEVNKTTSRYRTIQKKLLSLLQKHGITKIEFPDNRLIVGLCEVVETEVDSNRKNDEIISVIRNGYIRGKELIRPAQIIVVKN
ncbi:nucleotide exchange factor GrpE [Flavihumibacter stibioxidans]|uniref:Nucleotide exchange factor GrpE n=1 Tax=Flavihumibacter stibioxidans TaxID=1834163 RepID=A0ABR7M7Z2_9BACT|nr:nucleotide exchange factor GrpE [Flavihumibacter stibioxidans]MBC6490659.1 nucleotide exchange factor GrpE [Flavihumibacter stibioxidans]